MAVKIRGKNGKLNHAVKDKILVANPASRLSRFLRNQDEPEKQSADFLAAEEPEGCRERRRGSD